MDTGEETKTSLYPQYESNLSTQREGFKKLDYDKMKKDLRKLMVAHGDSDSNYTQNEDELHQTSQ